MNNKCFINCFINKCFIAKGCILSRNKLWKWIKLYKPKLILKSKSVFSKKGKHLKVVLCQNSFEPSKYVITDTKALHVPADDMSVNWRHKYDNDDTWWCLENPSCICVFKLTSLLLYFQINFKQTSIVQ